MKSLYITKRMMLLLFIGAFFIFPLISSAQSRGSGTINANQGTSIGGFDDVIGLIEKASLWLLRIIIAVSVIMILVGAFYYTTSGGSEDKVEKGKKYIIYAVVGIAVALLAQAIVSLTQQFVG
jgi:hypothetical protein